MMIADAFWASIETCCDLIELTKPDTFENLKAILDEYGDPDHASSGAFFAGGGGDRDLESSLIVAGWRTGRQDAWYYYTMRHGVTGEQLTYVEGDVQPGFIGPAPDHDPSIEFARANWHPYQGPLTVKADETGHREFKCDRYNPDTRLCEAHDDRPPVCSRYPFHGPEGILDTGALYNQCAYWLDVPAAEAPKGSGRSSRSLWWSGERPCGRVRRWERPAATDVHRALLLR